MKSDFETGSASFFLDKIERQLAKWQIEYGAVGQNFITILDAEYPDSLRELYDPPLFLFYRGRLELLKDKLLLTMVGSRKISSYHKHTAGWLISQIKNFPFVIVSGLAYGLDTIAHRAALENQLQTIAVLGSGLGRDVLYPNTNKGLADQIVERGGLLLSEYPDRAKPQLHFFPRRNRVLAGISRATIVISGAAKSGTLITAQCALDQGKDVLALPGNINQILSQGPNELIKNGAIPLLQPGDIYNVYGLDQKNTQPEIKFKDKCDAKIYSLLQIEPMSADQLCQKCSWPFGIVNTTVSRLELAGYIYLNQQNKFEIR